MEEYVVRANEPFLFKSFERPLISAVLGPRRVGKTTLLEHYIRLYPQRKWVHLTMDILHQRKRVAAGELELMIEQGALQSLGGDEKIWAFIDEAQKCPELFDQVKVIYDKYKGKNCVKFLLTGSAHLNLHKLTAESLAGRVELLHLREFNLREMALLHYNSKKAFMVPSTNTLDLLFNPDGSSLERLQENYSNLRPFQHKLRDVLENYIVWGGLPEIIEEPSDEGRLRYLGNYLQTYLEKDIRAIEAIGDLNLYQNVMKITAELTGSLRDDTKIIQALKCSRNTLSKYRSYLSATLQYSEVAPYIMSSLKRLTKSPKGYMNNNGLISYLTGIYNLSILESTGTVGHRFENWFLNEVQTWLDTQPERHSISFWRTPGGAEVDFIVSLGTHILPFEVTYGPRAEVKKIHNLKVFLKDEPKARLGVLCYTGPLAFDKEHRILFLPAWML